MNKIIFCVLLALPLNLMADTVEVFVNLDTLGPDHGPEGVAVDKIGNVYTTQGPGFWFGPGDGVVRKFDHHGVENETSPLMYSPGDGGPAGLATSSEGTVFVAWPNPGFPINGVYRMLETGPELMWGTENTIIANGLALDKDNNLYISDSVGLIWKMPADNSSPASVWSFDGLLDGCGDAGPNGIAFWKGDVYVANTMRGTLVRIPVNEDGSSGTAEIVAGQNDCFTGELFGIDGIAFDVHGLLYAALVLQNQVVVIDLMTDSVDVLLGPEDGLFNPASVAFGTGKGHKQTLFISNYALIPEMEPVFSHGPAILMYDVGVPGLPLP